MKNKYRAGVRIEREIQKKFLPPRYTTLRTAGSHGFCDVIVIDHKDPHVYFIQVKQDKKITSTHRKEWKAMQKIRLPISCSKEFWIKLPRQEFVAWGEDKDYDGLGLA